MKLIVVKVMMVNIAVMKHNDGKIVQTKDLKIKKYQKIQI